MGYVAMSYAFYDITKPFRKGEKYLLRRVGRPTVEGVLQGIVIPLAQNDPEEGEFPVMLMFETQDTPSLWYTITRAWLSKEEVHALRRAYKEGRVSLPALQNVGIWNKPYILVHRW